VESCIELVTLEGEGSIFTSTGFSPYGNVLGSANVQGTLFLWLAPSWEEIEKAEAAASDAGW